MLAIKSSILTVRNRWVETGCRIMPKKSKLKQNRKKKLQLWRSRNWDLRFWYCLFIYPVRLHTDIALLCMLISSLLSLKKLDIVLLNMFFVLCSANTSASTISANINSIPMLNETNFRDLKENAMIVLGCMDLALVPRIEQPTALTDKSSKTFRGSVSEKVTTAKKFLEAIEKHFAKNKSK